MSTTDTRLLLVEDEASQRALIAEILGAEGFQVRGVSSAEEALDALSEEVPDIILCDWRLPGASGGDLLDEVRERRLGCAFLVMTAYGSIGHAVEAVRRGADDYLPKPFEREALLLALERVGRTRRLAEENRRLRAAVAGGDGCGELIGRAPSMRTLYRTLEKVAATDATVLVTGESGTGKELVARTLHRLSLRSDGPFVAVNCAAIPESLMESELFGHERGAFTGAHRRRDGRFAEAEGGTLLLDEVASMPLPLQATLLRVLQERRLTRVGGTGEEAVDVRVIAASNRDLPAMVEEGSFREDLYYRLNVVPIQVPPLRERREDVPLLAAVLLERAAARHGRAAPEIPPNVWRVLMDHTWPGNVRELANVMERVVLLAEGDSVTPGDLPAEVLGEGGSRQALSLPPEGIEWDRMEAELLRQALARCDGNRAAAARILGLTYKAFLYRL